MRWCGSKILDHETANRISWQNPRQLRPWIFRDFQLIFAGGFPDISVMIWPVYEFNKLLLSPPRLGRTLIVYFQLIMKICYRNWYWCLSRPSRVRWAAEKIVRKCSVPGVVRLRACWASAYNSFFLLRSRGVLWQNERAGIFKFKIVKRKMPTRAQKGALSFAFVHFVFSGYFTTGLHVY